MKNRIALKLTLYFTITLLLFTFIIGGVFITLFKSHTVELYKDDLEQRAVAIASSLSEYMGDMGPSMMNRMGSFNSYLQHLDEIAMTDVWIFDQDHELFMIGHKSDKNYIYADLPEDIGKVVDDVFKGEVTFSQGFSSLLDAPTLTVGAPILSEGKVIGALLLHSPIGGMDQAVGQGVNILLISVLFALAISFILSILLAYTFSKPLNQMKRAAMQLAGGDYTAKTAVIRKDEIGDLANAIDVLSERLYFSSQESERLDQLRRDFVANVSHELRTPVTVIRGSLEALIDGVVTDKEQVTNYNRQMLNESIFLQRLVDDLLDLSRLQNADFQINLDELNLVDVVSDVVRSGRQLAQTKEVKIDFIQNQEILKYTGDYGRLRQMLLIILDNAVKFSQEAGTVTVSIKDGEIEIIDRGKGIEAQDLPYIFDRFYKVKSEDNINGTGLGLAIAKQIADRHHIKVSVSSVPFERTVFRFLF